jgi:hypothetical protein
MRAGIHFGALLLLAGLMAGCGTARPPRHYVVLIDASGSIDPAAEADAFQAIKKSAQHSRRGDSIAIIPIKGDAAAETEGSIIRGTVPVVREAYDQDIRRFTTELRGSLEKLEADVLAHPGDKTDILGSLDLAQEEIANAKPGEQVILVVLSDFIQEDGRLNFKTSRALANEAAAREFAMKMAHENQISQTHINVYLGGLRSGELSGLDQQRRKAIQAFWIRYLTSLGATPQFVTDGPGLLGQFVERRF